MYYSTPGGKKGSSGLALGIQDGDAFLRWGAAGGMGPAQAAHVEGAPAEDAWSYFCASGAALRRGYNRGNLPAAPGRAGSAARPAAWALKLSWHAAMVWLEQAVKGRVFPLGAGLLLRRVGPVWIVLWGGI